MLRALRDLQKIEIYFVGKMESKRFQSKVAEFN